MSLKLKPRESIRKKDIKPCKKNGFSLIQVLTATALLGLLSVGAVSLIQNSINMQSGVQAKGAQFELATNMKSILMDRKSCLNSFGGALVSAANAVQISAIKDAGGSIIYSVGLMDSSGFLVIESFVLQNLKLDIDSANTGTVDFYLNVSKKSNTRSNLNLKPVIISLRVKLNSHQEITDCYYAGSLKNGLWQRSLESFQDLYYMGGNIGVGRNDVKVDLDIAGDLRVRNTGLQCESSTIGAIRNRPIGSVNNLECCDGAIWKNCFTD